MIGVHSQCTLACPSGYHINFGPTSKVTDSRIRQTDGTWDYRAVTPYCKGMSIDSHFSRMCQIRSEELIEGTPASEQAREAGKSVPI